MESDPEGLTERSSPPQLQQLDAKGTATLNLSRAWRFGGELWELTQAGNPVGTLERTAGRVALRTVSEEWRGGVRRRARRLGWHLHFTPTEGDGPALLYYPNTLLSGGYFVASGSRRYRLRPHLLGGDWSLLALPEGEIGRLEFRERDPARYLSVQLTFIDPLFIDPLLLVVILAAGEALLIHDQQPRGGGAVGV